MNIVDTINNVTRTRSENFFRYTEAIHSNDEYGLQMQLLVMDRYDKKVSPEYVELQVKIAEKLLKKFEKINMPVDIITNANSFDVAMSKSMSTFDKVKNMMYSNLDTPNLINYIHYKYSSIPIQK